MLHIADGGTDRHGPIGQNFHAGRFRQTALQLRHQLLDPVNHLDHIGAGLALDVDDHCRLFIDPGREITVLLTFIHLGNLLQANGGAIAPGNDHVAILIGRFQLVVSIDRERPQFAVEIALGIIDVGIGYGRLDIRQAQVHPGNHGGVHLDPHGRPAAATH